MTKPPLQITGRYRGGMLLSEFNALDDEDARAVVRVWAAIPDWVDAVVSARPYASVDQLADAAAAVTGQWALTDLDAALASHPRIGERATGSGAEAAASGREQAAMSTASDDVADRIVAGNAAYEARFGRVFLIRAAGRSPEQIAGELERRLGNDHDVEAAEAQGQLADIAMLRLRTSIADDSVVAP